MGSVVKGAGSFQRKLKMMNAKVFALFCVSQNKNFVDNLKQSTKLKKGLITICNQTNSVDNLQFSQHLKGWKTILNEKMNKNTLSDVVSINYPTAPEKDLDGLFAYSAFLPAGIH